MNEVGDAESWNKKRIFVALFVLVIFTLGVYLFKDFVLSKSKEFFSKKSQPLVNSTKDVKGIDVREDSNTSSNPQPLSGVQRIVQEKLDTIKQEITTLNIQDIASSSPQFQKIIQDLQSLQQYPRNELKDVCRKVCSGF